jgi:hypothetical protein
MRRLVCRDPRTGEIIEWAEPQYPVPAPRPYCGPPAYPEDYFPPAFPQSVPSAPRRNYWGLKRRCRKGVTWGLGIPWFFISFALCEFHPAACVVSLAFLFGWVAFRSFRD